MINVSSSLPITAYKWPPQDPSQQILEPPPYRQPRVHMTMDPKDKGSVSYD